MSVLEAHRGRGLGGTLLARAHLHARNWGIDRLFIHCLSENAAMLHLARKEDMDIVSRSGESDAWLKLSPGSAQSRAGEAAAQRVALWDYALKSQSDVARRIADRRPRQLPGAGSTGTTSSR